MSDNDSTDVDSSTAAKLLLADEEVIRELRPAWSAYAIPLLLCGFTILGGLIMTLLASDAQSDGNEAAVLLFLGTVLFGGFSFGLVYMSRMQARYIVTNMRVLKITGLLNKKTQTMWLHDIATIQTSQSIFQRSRDYGSIRVARKPTSAIQQIPVLPLGGGITLGAVPDIYSVAKIIEAGSKSLK